MVLMRRGGLQPIAPAPEPANSPEADDSDAKTGSGPDKNSEPPASSPEGSDGEQDEQHLASGDPAPGPTLLIETPKNGSTEGEAGEAVPVSAPIDATNTDLPETPLAASAADDTHTTTTSTSTHTAQSEEDNAELWIPVTINVGGGKKEELRRIFLARVPVGTYNL
jgi:hypothetical protein